MQPHPVRKGFTLIELLVVIVIIGLLAAIAVSVFWRAKNRGFEAAMQSDLKAASVQQEHYFETHRVYAPSATALPNLDLSPGVSLEVTHADLNGWAGVARHQSATRRCALLIGGAPRNAAPPATSPGIVQCDEP
jgi:prepilin-type N-terminal cleavage/methylation domain-containing protein